MRLPSAEGNPRRATLPAVAAGRVRTVAAWAAVVIGTVIMVAVLGARVPARAADGDELLDRLAQSLDEDNLDALDDGHELFAAASEDLTEEALPRLGDALGDDDFVDAYPDVSAGVAAIPDTLELTDTILGNLRGGVDNLDDAEGLVPGASLHAGAWMLVVLGLGIAALGIWAMSTTAAAPLAVLAALGFALVVGPFVSGFDAKLQSTLDFFDTFKPFDDDKVESRREPVLAMEAMVVELQGDLLPDAADALGTTPEALTAELTAELPDLGEGLEEFEAIRDDFLVEVDTLAFAIPKLRDLDELPLRQVSWLLAVPGAVLASLAGAALVATRRDRRS